MSEHFSPGSIVRARDREWIVSPSEDETLLSLRPLMGGEHESITLLKSLELEHLTSATFPLPRLEQSGDFASARLLLDAARLNLRSGAGPLRCLGHISVRPRPYQFVPLLMALRMDTIRLLIADDVGIGKTIEAVLIAREMVDRGEVRRLAVLCPPHLCEQWKEELEEKFHLPAVIVRSGTISRLERELPGQDISVFQHLPCMVVSIDYAKSERRRDSFLLHCPEFVIVDEVHTAARPAGRSITQQQRHELVRDLADDPKRHMLFLTATPHSGVEESFLSILGLLKREFADSDMKSLTERQRIALAEHFVQRRRADVQSWLGEDTPFPTRQPHEVSYQLDQDYRALAEDVYDFARELVRTADTMKGFQRRVRYWTALALMRCVLSSPAAAEAALEGRATRLDETDDSEPDDAVFSPYVYDTPGSDETTIDVSPSYIIEKGQHSLLDNEQRRLRQFARRASQLRGKKDEKVQALADVVTGLLNDGHQVVVYCRYIATSDYVAAQLDNLVTRKHPKARIISITGALSEDERRARVLELAESPKRVLVATDCLSEGINLQEWFDAVIHYDLPWNPNRLEQREGRADRYGQRSTIVPTVLLYGRDNPVDGAVLDVLIRKAVEIRRDLGITVPVPVESESVIEAVVNSLFRRSSTAPQQLMLPVFEESPFERVDQIHAAWYESAAREKVSRQRFAQHAIKPAEVQRELEEVDGILGDPAAVQRFVLEACQRLGSPLVESRHGWKLDPLPLPADLRDRLGLAQPVFLAFSTPTPERAEFVGRNHRMVAGLAEHLLAISLDADDRDSFTVSRCGAIRTQAVSEQTTLLLLRMRHLLHEADSPAGSLAEECVVVAFRGAPGNWQWLQAERAYELLDEIQRPDGPTSRDEVQRRLAPVSQWLESDLQPELRGIAENRSRELLEAHRRVRRVARLRRLSVKPAWPVDVLGAYVLIPIPRL
jgi:superfamily II DNA or RNA helicase